GRKEGKVHDGTRAAGRARGRPSRMEEACRTAGRRGGRTSPGIFNPFGVFLMGYLISHYVFPVIVCLILFAVFHEFIIKAWKVQAGCVAVFMILMVIVGLFLVFAAS
ncbi:MAG: hypothetical protein Q4F72_10510, partial [Desulfovibrionaceae bacterium]|nr:hypothetical protein [Desulfovibrionaceae bacterium]